MASIEVFKGLVGEAIEEMKQLPPPLVRIAGPLRTGGDGYEINLQRLKTGEALLQSRGLTVFGYSGKYAEAIKAAYDLHFTHFHIPILKTGLISSIFFLPKWQESGGASYERKLCDELGIEAGEITLDELSKFESESRDE
ncbi:hypothetical protein K2X83_00710 [Patescibacteria group bacterium]|nr:hypothetical protein [Patescibacteria group bacterium]